VDLVTSLAATTNIEELGIEMGTAVAGETEGLSKDNGASLLGDAPAAVTEGKWKDGETACSGALSPDTAGGMTIGQYGLGLVVGALLGRITGGITACGGALS